MNNTPLSGESPAQAYKRLSVAQYLRALEQPVRFLKGIGPSRAAQLESIGLTTVEDLLFHLPFRYEDRRAIQRIRDTSVGATATCIGRLTKLRTRFNLRRRSQTLSAVLIDESAALNLFWYRAPVYLVQRLTEGARLLVHGKIEADPRGGKRIIHSDFDVLDGGNDDELQRILPVYVHPAGTPASLLRGWIADVLAEHGRYLPSFFFICNLAWLCESAAARPRLECACVQRAATLWLRCVACCRLSSPALRSAYWRRSSRI
jgi:RecG-like helicase